MSLSFNNIVGSPCQTVIDAVKNDPELAEKEIRRQQRIQQALNALGPPPSERDFPRPGSGSREVIGEPTGVQYVGPCPVTIYQKSANAALGSRLWSFHQASNRYDIEVATIRCIENPEFYKTATQTFTFSAKLSNKNITKTENTFHYQVKCEDTAHSPSINAAITNDKINLKYFDCPINNNDGWYNILSDDIIQNNNATFDLTATVSYKIYYPNGDWYINAIDSKLTITIKNSTKDDFPPKSINTQSFKDLIGSDSINTISTIVSNLYKKWLTFNSHKDEKLLSQNKATDHKQIDCADDCDRALQICVLKKSIIKNFIKTDPWVVTRPNQPKPKDCKLT